MNPDAETYILKLAPEQQALIRRALGGNDPPYEGCFSEGCLDLEPAWVVRRFGRPGDGVWSVSRCTRCKMPKAFGRDFTGLHDLLAPTLEREIGRIGDIRRNMQKDVSITRRPHAKTKKSNQMHKSK